MIYLKNYATFLGQAIKEQHDKFPLVFEANKRTREPFEYANLRHLCFQRLLASYFAGLMKMFKADDLKDIGIFWSFRDRTRSFAMRINICIEGQYLERVFSRVEKSTRTESLT